MIERVNELRRGEQERSMRWSLKSERPSRRKAVQESIPGDDLLSHTVARAVPSALRGLTAVFGMGTGGSPSLEPPETLISECELAQLAAH